MAEKTAPATIWACMEGPMVGLFVSGGYTAGWPKYIRADSHDKLVEALKAARTVIQEDRDELFDSVTVAGIETTMDEIDRPSVERMDAILAKIDAALASLEQESGQ